MRLLALGAQPHSCLKEVHMNACRPALALSSALVLLSSVAGAQMRVGSTSASAPAGMCRVWIDGQPADRQPAPTDCATARARAALLPHARVIYGSNTSRGVNQSNDPRYDSRSAQRDPRYDSRYDPRNDSRYDSRYDRQNDRLSRKVEKEREKARRKQQKAWEKARKHDGDDRNHDRRDHNDDRNRDHDDRGN
jgi:hypothetical protein